MDPERTAYFTTNGMFTRVPEDARGALDWEDAEVGTSEDYWATPNADYDVQGQAGSRIDYADLPANLQD